MDKDVQVRKKEDAKYKKRTACFLLCLSHRCECPGWVRDPDLVKGIEDLFYWIFMSAYIFSQIYATMYGSIRWYFLLGLVFGVAVIQKLIASGEKIHKKTRKNLEIIRKNR